MATYEILDEEQFCRQIVYIPESGWETMPLFCDYCPHPLPEDEDEEYIDGEESYHHQH